MVTIVKEANGNDETCFRFFEWLQIMFIGMMNGWRSSHTDPMVFDEANSKQFCVALENGLSEIENELLPAPNPGEPICPRLYLASVTKQNQLELIDDLLAFCDGELFRVKVEN
jgi:hypothetical protein